MKKIKIIFAITLLTCNYLNAQVSNVEIKNEIKPLVLKVNNIQEENKKLQSKYNLLNNKIKGLNQDLDNLKAQNTILTQSLSQSTNELGVKIKATGEKSDNKITEVSESLSKNSLYSIIGVLLAIITSGVLYVLIRKRQDSQKIDLVDQLSKTKSSIEESLVKEFEKQTVQIDNQIIALNNNNKTASNTIIEPDHSLALKVCSQINVMQNNISRMDQNVKGLKQIKKSIENLKDNLAANGYEIADLIGKQFHPGMKVIVTSSLPDENLDKDYELISNVLIPQVNYNDKMIQTAQIVVSVGY
jgi:hypothetical protein